MAKILITGAAGFIASALVRNALMTTKYDIRAFARLTDSERLKHRLTDHAIIKESLQSGRLELVYGDLCGDISGLCEGVDFVINAGAKTFVDHSIRDPMPFMQSNTVGTLLLLEEARRQNVKRFLQVSCYDQSTKALTTTGLKSFQNINIGDEVLSLNTETGQIENKKVLKVIVQDYAGDMLCFNDRKIDMLVTPNHRMLFHDKNQPGKIYINTADALSKMTNTCMATGKWQGLKQTTTFVDGIGQVDTAALFYVAGMFIGDGFLARQSVKRPNKSGLNRAEFLHAARNSAGQFMTGKLGVRDTCTCTCHRIFFDVPENDKGRARLEQSLTNLGIKWHAQKNKSGEHIYFASRAWSKFFKQFGKYAKNKHIPSWMLMFDTTHLTELFDGIVDSDGHYRHGNCKPSIATCSVTLVENLCELGFKLGLFPRFVKRGYRESVMKSGRIIRPTCAQYNVYFRAAPVNIGQHNATKQYYSGKIWCLTVEDNKNFIIERNGILAFSGNTDETYGPALNGAFDENAPIKPTNPYAASKAAADAWVQAYAHAYGLFTVISKTENNYGPFQHQQKVIPTFIKKLMLHEKLPIYGDGLHVRQWLWVDDHVNALLLLLNADCELGGIYNVAGGEEITNIEMAAQLIKAHTGNANLTEAEIHEYIKFIDDSKIRPGHDRRYALNNDKIRKLGWVPQVPLDKGINDIVKWHHEHPEWLGVPRT